jgi:hypothetical protein
MALPTLAKVVALLVLLGSLARLATPASGAVLHPAEQAQLDADDADEDLILSPLPRLPARSAPPIARTTVVHTQIAAISVAPPFRPPRLVLR